MKIGFFDRKIRSFRAKSARKRKNIQKWGLERFEATAFRIAEEARNKKGGACNREAPPFSRIRFVSLSD
ncbi:hypothetical protein [Methyloligella solikamskensis]|uniref:Uncharacterized protein n=1 Tax=Methyloligella solikamskensis TaxID=1177756 RepID=A0ABW3J844_9HYPH